MNGRGALVAQALRGPILLIAVGTLSAIHQAGILPLTRTWPLILILIGLMKLIERMFVPQPPPVPSGYSQNVPPRGFAQ